MARYIGPKSKIARRFGEPIFGADKVLSKRNFPPGQHGNNRRRKMSEYGVMLAEKQKAKYTYGVLERQFRNMFDKAAKADGITGEVLLQNLECRLDNVVFRLGIAPTRAAARQLVGHKHIVVDGKVVNIPSFAVKPGMVVGLPQKSLQKHRIHRVYQRQATRAQPLSVHYLHASTSAMLYAVPQLAPSRKSPFLEIRVYQTRSYSG